ncbi:MAG: hypothetical protein ABFE13_12075 [Phycisphaerales bacterium]
MPATEYLANLIAVAAKGGTAYQGPATIYLELVSDTPDADTAGTPIVYTNYARTAYTQSDWASDGVGGLSNTTVITFPAPGGGEDTAVAVEAWTASSGGTRLWWEDLTTVVDITDDTPALLFSPGALTWTVI